MIRGGPGVEVEANLASAKGVSHYRSRGVWGHAPPGKFFKCLSQMVHYKSILKVIWGKKLAYCCSKILHSSVSLVYWPAGPPPLLNTPLVVVVVVVIFVVFAVLFVVVNSSRAVVVILAAAPAALVVVVVVEVVEVVIALATIVVIYQVKQTILPLLYCWHKQVKAKPGNASPSIMFQ